MFKAEATDGAATTLREHAWQWLGVCLAALISFILVRIAVLNVFYDTGDLHDPGWLASIAWHNDWRLRGPPAYPASYLTEHTSLIFWLTNAVSYIVPLAKFDYYAVLIAAIYALYAAGVCRAWQLTDTRSTAPHAALAMVVALVATFSAVGMMALRLPHQEMAIPALALWFLIALAQRAYVAATIWFVLCLSVREDAGLHLFAPMVLWGGALILTHRRASVDLRPMCGFAVAALGYSALAFLAKHVEAPITGNFTRAYAGNPAWAHVTVPFLVERVNYYVTWRGYVLWPLLLSVGWSLFSRNPLLPLGYLACIPWLMLSIVAVHVAPGTLSYYYGFPFWLALAWPLVALRLWRDMTGRQSQRWPYALLLLASTIGWGLGQPVVYALDENFFRQNPFAYTEALHHLNDYQDFVNYFAAHRDEFETTDVDQAMLGLLIDHTDQSNWLELQGDAPLPDTLIYFAGGVDWPTRVLPLLRTGHYHCIYEIPGTQIRLAARDALRERLTDPTLLTWASDSHDLTGAPAGGC